MADEKASSGDKLAGLSRHAPFYKKPPFYIGLGVVGVGLILLRRNALAKARSASVPLLASPPSPPPVARTVAPSPPAIAQTLPPLVTNPDGTDHTQGTPFVFSTNSDAAAAVAEANRLGISVHQLLLQKSGQLPPAGGAVVTAPGQQAVVTTVDPAPSGDLIIRAAPNGTQIGGADKDGIVTILQADALGDGVWAQIEWSGGRNAAATGFSRKKFLKLIRHSRRLCSLTFSARRHWAALLLLPFVRPRSLRRP